MKCSIEGCPGRYEATTVIVEPRPLSGFQVGVTVTPVPSTPKAA